MSRGRRRYLLLVNPSAGGGRARELLPRIEAAMSAAGLEHRAVLTRGSSTAATRPARRPPSGEITVVISGDGLIGQVGGALAEHRGDHGRDLRRARQRLRPGARDPRRRRRAPWRCSPAGDTPRDRRRRGQRPALPLHRELRVRLGREPDRERGAAGQGPPRLRLRGAAGARRLEAGRRSRSRSTASASSCAATGSPSPTARPTAAACTPPPTPSSTTACSTWSR